MRLADGPLRNFTDNTGKLFSDNEKYLTQSLERPLLDPDALPPGGYNGWILKQLKSLTPDEYQMLKRGMTLQDIYAVRALQHGRLHLDPSVPLYRK